MAIVSYEFYTNTYMGEPLAESDFPRYDARAELIIRNMTKGATDRFEEMTPETKEAVQNAICAQIEYFNLNGLDISLAGRTGGGFTVGKVSVQGGNGAKTGASSIICPLVYSFLEQTGLLNPAVATFDKPFFWIE